MLINTGIHVVDAKLSLTLKQREWLGYGLKFAQTPIVTAANYLSNGISDFKRKLLWRLYWFHHNRIHANTAKARSSEHHYIAKLHTKSSHWPDIQSLTKPSPTDEPQQKLLKRQLLQEVSSVNQMTALIQRGIHKRSEELARLIPEHIVREINDAVVIGASADSAVARRRDTLLPVFSQNNTTARLLHAPYTPFTRMRMFHSLPNLSRDGSRFIANLRSNSDFVIKPADKNLGLTIMSRSWYENEALRQLKDHTTYQPVDTIDEVMMAAQSAARKFYEWLNNNANAGLRLEERFICPAIWKPLKRSLLAARKAHETHCLHWQSSTRATSGGTAESALASFTVPSFYLTPKIHKPIVKGRPIVATHSWITTTASCVVDYILQSYMKQIPTVLRDSKELVQLIELTPISSETIRNSLWPSDHHTDHNHLVDKQNILLATADVESLYTNIDIEDGLAKLREFLQLPQLQPRPPPELVDFIINTMSFVLKNNFMNFRIGPHTARIPRYFKQLQGTAMGTNAAVAFANIYMFMLEYPLLLKYRHGILLYKRFLDDIFAVFSDAQTFNAFRAELDAQRPRIKLTWAPSPTEVEFLDLVLLKAERFHSTNRLDIRIHQKMMNTYLYIPARSFHTKKQLRNFIINELQRYIRNCSAFDDFIDIKRAFYERLRVRGYGPAELQPLFDITITPQTDYKRRAELIADRDRGPLTAADDSNCRISTDRDIISENHKYFVCCRQGSCTSAQPAAADYKMVALVVPSTPHSQAINLSRIVGDQWSQFTQPGQTLHEVLGTTSTLVAYTKPCTIQQRLCNNSH